MNNLSRAGLLQNAGKADACQLPGTSLEPLSPAMHPEAPSDCLEETPLYDEFSVALEHDSDAALTLARRLVSDFPKFPLAHYSLALVLESHGEWADALLAYRDVDAVDKAAWESLGKDPAIPASAMFAVECAGALSAARLGIARCLEEMQMPDAAIEAYKAILQDEPDNSQARGALERLLP